jgi:hypothetical protein
VLRLRTAALRWQCQEVPPALVLYRIILIQPTAPIPLFGAAAVKAQGRVVIPLLGFTICLYLALHLGTAAKIAGFVWLVLGMLDGVWRTSWFRKPMDFARIAPEEERALAATAPELVTR